MSNFFESPFKGVTLDRQVKNPNIVVGRHSYYSGYYHGHSFDDCARYLLPDDGVDKLIIGSFCSIGSGPAFIMAGNQGHRTTGSALSHFSGCRRFHALLERKTGLFPLVTRS